EEDHLADKQKSNMLLKEEVDEEDIANVVSRWTSIPVNKLMEGEREKLVRLEDVLHERVIGQEQAVNAVSAAVLRARAGIKDPNRPIGSFIFLGPTGVGKTELARTLAQTLFDDEHSIIRIDMSEYMEKHSVSRLIGAPPGYVGYDEGGQLTETVRRRPYSVILFDEIEKAHSDVFNVMLQILDEGRLTDGKGRTISFKNTVIIMTSNIGSQEILDFQRRGESSYEKMKEVIDGLMHRHFRPEFLNRVDEVVVFHALELIHIQQIARIMLVSLAKHLETAIRLKLEWSEDALIYLAKKGYDPSFGARPMKRLIQTEIETPLSRLIVKGDVQPGSSVLLKAEDNHLALEVR
ncbi:MAG: type VI secretion system ATPase TssH, partial [Firmicutes bacterium HGW-Firmicutes-12]